MMFRMMVFEEVMLAPLRIRVPTMTEDENPQIFKYFQELFLKKKSIFENHSHPTQNELIPSCSTFTSRSLLSF